MKGIYVLRSDLTAARFTHSEPGVNPIRVYDWVDTKHRDIATEFASREQAEEFAERLRREESTKPGGAYYGYGVVEFFAVPTR